MKHKPKRHNDKRKLPRIDRRRWSRLRDDARRAGLYVLVMGNRWDFLSTRTGLSVVSWSQGTRVAWMADGRNHQSIQTAEDALALAKLHSRG